MKIKEITAGSTKMKLVAPLDIELPKNELLMFAKILQEEINLIYEKLNDISERIKRLENPKAYWVPGN